MFWLDLWINGRCVRQIAPAVLALVPRAKARSRTVASGISDSAWVSDIVGVRTVK